MKAKTFENLIRKVVREEIDYALRREIKTLKEDLREEIYIEEPKQIHPPKKTIKEEIMGSQPLKKTFNKRQFTQNNALNDLLNETAQGDTNLDRGTPPISMEGNFHMESNSVNNIGGMPVESAPKAVVDAVTRDYSDLMKAINKKKKN